MSGKRRTGTVRKIELDDGGCIYGVELRHPFMAFYQTECEPIGNLDELPERPILFVLAVMDEAVDHWKEVGHIEIASAQIPIPDRYMQSRGDASRIHRVDAEFNSTSATYEEVKELEKVMVWSKESVEERLEDHYAGRTNRIWQRTRPVKPEEKSGQDDPSVEVELLANDDALSWFYELQFSSDPIDFIKQCVHRVHGEATRGEYIDIDRCRWILAAGVLMTTVHGEPFGKLPEFVSESIHFDELEERDDLLDLITQMVRMAGHSSRSELREVWKNSEGFNIWLSKVDELANILQKIMQKKDETRSM